MMPARKQPRKTLRSDIAALIDDCPGWNSRLVARRITQFLDHQLAEADLGIAQLGLMAQIAVIADDSLTALAARTGLEQSTLSRNLRALERQGLVEIGMVPGNLRRRVVWLTEAGARRLEAALPAWRAANQRLEQSLPAQFARLCATAADKMP